MKSGGTLIHHVHFHLIKSLWVLFALTLSLLPSPAQTSPKNNGPVLLRSAGLRAPLLVFTNGPGHVAPFHNGQMLEVGPEYEMVAIPHAGYVFAGWSEVIVFTFVMTVIDESGNASTVTSRDLSPEPGLRKTRVMRFTVSPPDVLEDIPGYLTITRTTAWQANFVRVP